MQTDQNQPPNTTDRKDSERWWVITLLVIFCALAVVYALIKQPIKLNLPDVAGWVQEKSANQTAPGFYNIEEVADGDTIVVDMNGVSERVRLIGVDTPETHRPNTPVQCYGPEASEFLKNFLNNKAVRLEADPTNSNRDRYGRLLRYVYLDDGTLVNELIISKGNGFAYVRFPFQKKTEFLDTEKTARSSGLGLWSACKYEIDSGQYKTDDNNAI
jgi:endonuclease YncB( thermonuclease family)